MSDELSAGERVTFTSRGETVAGLLFAAERTAGPALGVAILGPMTYVKEQAPLLYARRLARLGHPTLIFDPRYRGDSGGLPRCYEDPAAKMEDLRAALDHLAARPEVDEDRLAVLGICMGSSTAVQVAADDPRVGAVATVAAHVRDAEADAQWLGGPDAVARRLERGEQARRRYADTGDVAYVPAVHAERTDVGMPGELPWSWYRPWADRGRWENRYAVMSDAALLPYEGLSAAARLTKPLLMVHGDLCALPEAARRHFDAVPTADKRLLRRATPHLRYYDDAQVIDRTAADIAAWYDQHLPHTAER